MDDAGLHIKVLWGGWKSDSWTEEGEEPQVVLVRDLEIEGKRVFYDKASIKWDKSGYATITIEGLAGVIEMVRDPEMFT